MKNVTKISALIILICLLLCSCSAPYSEREIPSKNPTYYNIYVSGAVENDGYFSFVAGGDFREVLTEAGVITDVTYFSYDLSRLLTRDITEIIFNYSLNGVMHYSVNVNSALIISRSYIENVEPRVVDKLADYIEHNGKITNREDMRQALGEDFNDNFYKFFISEQDYA